MRGRPLGSVNRSAKFSAKGVPSLIDVAWAAGLYEGEGSAYLINPNGKLYAKASMTQKDKWVLYRMQHLFGGHVSSTAEGMGRWEISGARAVAFLYDIYEFLSPRRKKKAMEVLCNFGEEVSNNE